MISFQKYFENRVDELIQYSNEQRRWDFIESYFLGREDELEMYLAEGEN